KAFERAHPKPVITLTLRSHQIVEARPRIDGHGRVDPSAKRPRLMSAAEDAEIVPRAHVMNRRHALGRHSGHRRVQVRLALRHARRGYGPLDKLLSIVFENAGRITVCVTNDYAAFDVRC